jgi:hypothetical protein
LSLVICQGAFKKWRNRPGCDGAFSLFLLNDRGGVRGAGCRVRLKSGATVPVVMVRAVVGCVVRKVPVFCLLRP